MSIITDGAPWNPTQHAGMRQNSLAPVVFLPERYNWDKIMRKQQTNSIKRRNILQNNWPVIFKRVKVTNIVKD